MVVELFAIATMLGTNSISTKLNLRSSVSYCCVADSSPVNCEQGPVAWCELTARNSLRRTCSHFRTKDLCRATDPWNASPATAAAPATTRTAAPVSAAPVAPAVEPGLLRALQSQLDLVQSNMMNLQAALEKTQERLERIERELGLS
jgi:hypothetical protein